MNWAFGGLLTGLFIGWWFGTITAACCVQADASVVDEVEDAA